MSPARHPVILHRRLAAPLLLSPARGADTAVWLTNAPEVAGISGEYFARRRPIRPSRAAQDAEAARRLWAVSEALTGMAGLAPGISALTDGHIDPHGNATYPFP